MADDNEPPDSKLTRTKEKWAREGRFLTGRVTRPGEDRLPPGQHLTRDWPVLDLGMRPHVSRERWQLEVFGAVDHPGVRLGEPSRRSRRPLHSDIHCVTTWSRYDNEWKGSPLATCFDLPAARRRAFVVLHCYDGYTTNVTLADFAAEDAVLVHSW